MKKQDMRFKVGWQDYYLKAFFSRVKPIGGVWLDCRGPIGLKNYDALSQRKQEIEAAFGRELTWTAEPQRNLGSLSIRFSGFDATEQDDWPRQHELITSTLVALHAAVKPFIEHSN